MIEPEHVPAMVREGVKLVLSAHPPSTEVVRDLNQAGIVQIPIYMSNEFRHADIIAQAVNEVEPEEVLIHCAHGVDRSGNILAFLRVVFHGWPISDALYAVVNRDQEDLAGLIAVLQAAGINDVRTLDDPTVGYDSLVCVGRGGGMKARSDSYRRLIATNIIEMERYRR